MFKYIIPLSLLAVVVTAFSVDRDSYSEDESSKEVDNVFKKECDLYGGPDAFDNLMTAKDKFKTVVEEIGSNMTRIQSRDAHVIIRNNCRILPTLRESFTKFINAAKPCTKPDKREDLQQIINIMDDLTNFLCAKNGESLISFIDEGGPACVGNAKEEIVTCYMSTLSKYGEKTTIEIDYKEACRDLTKLQNCIVDSLKTCPKPAPARFINNLFTVLLNRQPCNAISNNVIA